MTEMTETELEQVCRRAEDGSWTHLDPYTEYRLSGVVISGCRACGVKLVD